MDRGEELPVKTRVLLVEDSRTQARRAQDALERGGFEVTVRHDGAAGLRVAIDDPPDIVLSDVLMPELDGFALCRALRAASRTERLPVVLMTSLTEPDDVLRALAVGADGYVSKPVDDAVLVDRLRKVLAQREAPEPSIMVGGAELPIRASRETILSVLTCALEDASARQAELAASRERLEQAKAQQDEIMGVVAHELRTPMNVLALRAGLEAASNKSATPAEGAPGGASITTASSSGKKLPPLADFVARNVRAMSAIVDDLLDVARIESGDIRVQPRLADVAPLVRDVGERFAMVSAGHPIEVEIGPDVVALHDPSRLEQMLANLVANAIKYSPQGGRIVIRALRRDDVVRIEVDDEGMGLPVGFEERLFGRYVRAPGSERVAKGVGLGLYICRRLAELQGGSIGVERLESRGTRFWLTFPVHARSTPTRADDGSKG
jgi:two-component system sensor histidine kinase/response regulator